jgi:putative DNA primase/helicase
MSGVLASALTYVARGWPLLPLKPASKIPAAAHGVNDASRDPVQAKRWWGNGIKYGVAIACGEASGLLVLDIDPRSGGDESLGALEQRYGRLPETVRSISGRGDGGTHYYFKHPVGAKVRGKLGDGLDVKSTGGYVVAPPSLHPDTGKPYQWDAGAHPDETPIADAPSWLIELLTRDAVSSTPVIPIEAGDALDTVLGAAFDAAEMLGGPVKGGKRIVECPWAHEHTDGRGAGTDSSTIILPPTSARKFGAFVCAHGHCTHRTFDDVLRALPAKAVRGAFAKYNLLAPSWLAPKVVTAPAKAVTTNAPIEPTRAADGEGITAARTDLRNAERLVEWFGSDLRFCTTWRKWLVWDEKRWALDETGRAHRCAANTARRMLATAMKAQTRATEALGKATGDGNDDAKAEAEKTLKSARADVAHAINSQSAKRIGAMLEIAESDPRLAVHHEALDGDPMLLNVENGTIDLRTGKLRKHRRDDLITKLAPVAFDAAAAAPVWLAFLDRAMGDDGELVAFLQRLTGYALSGDVREHILAFFHGPGGNGKSVFLGSIHTLLGDYASAAPRNLLFRSRGDRHPTELASLHGRRFVTCSEIEEGHVFDEALVKDLTGGDPIECRRMREDFWGFMPTHKLFIAGNHKPSVRGDDNGIWRRMRLIPWAVSIPEAEQDKTLPEKLRAEAAGILAWAVQGCLAWQRAGLGAPPAVQEATAQYRGENDLLGQFFRSRVIFEPTGRVTRKRLREEYESFCEELGAEPFGAKRFTARLRELGASDTSIRIKGLDGKPSVADGWRGVRLASTAERAADALDGGAVAPAQPKPEGAANGS